LAGRGEVADRRRMRAARSLPRGGRPQHDVSSGLLWNWRRQARRGLLRVDLAPNFFPVQVTGEPVFRDPGQRATSLAVPPGTPASADCQIEIMLADGTMVRTGQNVSLAALRRVLTALRG
jgi:transposase